MKSPDLQVEPRTFRNWLRHTLGLDRAIGFTILARAWSSSAGIITVLLIARFLTPAEQGYYYTFGSLVALQIIFELGFSYVILQLASHERVHVAISPEHEMSGDSVAHARLASIFQRLIRWYATAAAIMAVALIIAGFQFFSAHRQPGTVVAWRLPWCADVLAATLTFLFDPILSFMEGCGFVANVARLRLQQAAAGSLLAWLALSTHHGLFAPAMMIFGTASTSFFWLLRRWKLLFGLWRHDPGKHHVLWGKEVWPFQWRIAVSWLSGYFIFQLFNPILFAFRGAAVAGQMGMSLNVVNALQAVAISWISTKSAPFGGMIARRDFAQLDKVFFRALIQAMCVFMAGGVLAWSIVVYLNMKHPGLAHRLLSPTLIAIMLLTTAMNVVVTAEATYLRAHKQEKFLINSVLGAIFVGSAAYFLGRSYGAAGIVMGNLVIAILLGLGGGTYVFWKYRRLWHADTPTQYGR